MPYMVRIVSDVLNNGYGPVAFKELQPNLIEIGGPEGKYLGICPWCTQDLGEVTAQTYEELYSKLYRLIYPHMQVCPERNSTTMQVGLPHQYN